MAEKRPNIILIMVDDLGVEGIGSYGGLSYKTPKLDKLASEGIRFTHAYAQPLCTNTRMQLMTGLYNNRNWQYFGILPQGSKTIGHYMQEAGYNTCIAGKWQLQSYDPPDYPGSELRRGTGVHPKDAGFDEYSLYHSLHTEDKGSRYADPTYLENGELKKELKGKYGPDMWLNYVKSYIDRKKNDSKPFFVYYPMALPHWPMVPTPDSPEWKEHERRLEEDLSYFKDMV
ncbi:MAG: sulfatase-like hydrolase/transferase, partial [Lentisphaeraceae bacterium]|nr:sulfatase-like hydrolase/transferase [Lentisphaeraceae bacterium]